MDVPSMVQRSGDTLIVRSVVSGDQIYLDQETGKVIKPSATSRYNRFPSSAGLDGSPIEATDELEAQVEPKDEGLPQCKIKRNYSCNSCTFFTQNPRYFLTHQRDVHGEKIIINECKLCLYASRHYQKLVRHMKMVHGSTEGIEEHGQSRKRQSGRENRKRKLEESFNTDLPDQQPIITPPNKFPDHSTEDAPQNRLLKCSMCNFTTLYKDQLVEHEQEDHCKTKFFRCEKCTYVTHIKARFSKHVKYHSMPMIKCVTCDFRTPYKWNLDRHMKNHGGTGPFKCAACNFTADIKQSLTVHEMNHHVPPVGHAAGMSMARRKNKVGGTDIPEDCLSENGDIEDTYNNNNNNIDEFDESYAKKYKLGDDDQPTDLSQKGSQESGHPIKKAVRPVPNLIPIQTAGSALNLTKTSTESILLNQKGLPTCKSPLKDFAPLFFSENKIPGLSHMEKAEPPQASPSSCSSTTSKKKGENFFNTLKETLAANAARNENLICSCGYTSKCLSESILHRKTCRKMVNECKHSSPSPINLSVNSGSTRCQYCRHRCKSSADLASHIKNCSEAGVRCQNDSFDSLSDINDKQDEDGAEEYGIDGTESKHPMENKVFVWNKMPNFKNELNFNTDTEDERRLAAQQNNENSYYGVETAPGYGEMTAEEEAANSSLKKVYKCPHCSFWASTASRFHVHIVGHLNKKPFECSFCSYRSNWRWDITKHIRLKTIRDPNHKVARVLMNDETGRRNYTKYNKYITLMKVTDEDGDPKLLKSGEMTPNQEASLAFYNEYNNSLPRDKSSDNDGENDRQIERELPKSGNGDVSDSSRFIRLPYYAPAMLGTGVQPERIDKEKRSPPALIKPSDDLLTQNIDVKPDGSEKRTLYKCRKCDYRNSNRDIVLSHVKDHYQDVGSHVQHKGVLPAPFPVAINPNVYVNNVLAAMCLSQAQMSLADKAGKQPPPHISREIMQSHSMGTAQQSIPSAENPIGVPLNLGMASKTLEHGEMDERHCRLKHNGDIRIETVDRNSSKSSPIYYPLQTQPGTSGSNVLSNNTISQSISPSNNQDIKQNNKPTCASTSKRNQNIDQKSRPNSVNLTDELEKPKPDIDAVDGCKARNQQCPLCPFISESKSQMNYHFSLHKYKPDTYECKACNLTFAKKQQLNTHNKTCQVDEATTELGAIDLRSKNSQDSLISQRTLCFCPYCPARYIGSRELKQHIKMHKSDYPYHCSVCSYSSKQEHSILSHSEVHTNSYQEKSKKLRTDFIEDTEYACPNLVQVVINSERFWIVSKTNETEEEETEGACNKNVANSENLKQKKDSQPGIEYFAETNIDGNENGNMVAENGSAIQGCPYCPFETNNPEYYKSHLQYHARVSKQTNQYNCNHCDFSVSDEKLLKEHNKLHFQLMKQCKSVTFYTSYNKLELNAVNLSQNGDNQIETVYKDADEHDSSESGVEVGNCSPGHKAIVDVTTGEVVSRSVSAS